MAPTYLTYRVRMYVGPVHVEHYTANAQRAHYVAWAGTEHVYVSVRTSELHTETDRLILRQRIAEIVYGRPMTAGWRDVEILGSSH